MEDTLDLGFGWYKDVHPVNGSVSFKIKCLKQKMKSFLPSLQKLPLLEPMKMEIPVERRGKKASRAKTIHGSELWLSGLPGFPPSPPDLVIRLTTQHGGSLSSLPQQPNVPGHWYPCSLPFMIAGLFAWTETIGLLHSLFTRVCRQSRYQLVPARAEASPSREQATRLSPSHLSWL